MTVSRGNHHETSAMWDAFLMGLAMGQREGGEFWDSTPGHGGPPPTWNSPPNAMEPLQNYPGTNNQMKQSYSTKYYYPPQPQNNAYFQNSVSNEIQGGNSPYSRELVPTAYPPAPAVRRNTLPSTNTQKIDPLTVIFRAAFRNG